MSTPFPPKVQTQPKTPQGRHGPTPDTQGRRDLRGKGIGSDQPASSFDRLQELMTGIEGYRSSLKQALLGLKGCHNQWDLLKQINDFLLGPSTDLALITRKKFWDDVSDLCQELTKLPCLEAPPDCPEQITLFNMAIETVQTEYRRLLRDIYVKMPSAEAEIAAAWARVLDLKESFGVLQTQAGALKQTYYEVADSYLTSLALDAQSLKETLPYARRELQDEVRASAQAAPKSLTPAVEDSRRSSLMSGSQNPTLLPSSVQVFTFTLSGKEIGALVDNLVTAFDEGEFSRLLVMLEHPLEQNAASKSNLSDAMMDVFGAANRQGWIEPLLNAVAEERKGRADIQALIGAVRQSASQRATASTQNVKQGPF
jgi:hypothetical protein